MRNWRYIGTTPKGGYLDPKLIRQARKEEIIELHKYEVYEKRPIEECLRVTGKKPVGIRWVDINKGDELNPEYRSRIVAKDLKTKRDLLIPSRQCRRLKC